MSGKILYFPTSPYHQAKKPPQSHQKQHHQKQQRQNFFLPGEKAFKERLPWLHEGLHEGAYNLAYYSLLAIPLLTAIPLLYYCLKD